MPSSSAASRWPDDAAGCVTAYFVERLTIRLWACSVLPRLLRDWLRHGARARHCYVIDGSRPALLAARLSARLVGVGVETLAFRLVEVRDEAGLLIRLRIAYTDLADVQADVMREPIFHEAMQQPDSRLARFLAKGVATLSLSDRGTMWRALLIVQICAWHRRKQKMDEGTAVLFLERRPWLRNISRYAARYGITVVEVSPAVHLPVLVRRLLTPTGVEVARTLRDWLYLRVGPGPTSPTRAPEKSPAPDGSTVSPEPADHGRGGPRVAVEYYGHFNLNQPERHSDLFFWQRSPLSGGDVLVTFPHPQDPLDEAKWAALREHGISAIALHPRATTLQSVPVFVHRPRLARVEAAPPGPGALRKGPEAKWLRQQVERFSVLLEYWAELFASQNVKVYVTWYRYDANLCAIAEALRQLGGVTAVYQRALEVGPSPEFAIDADLMFGYSPRDADVDRRSGSVIPYHVAVGYFGDHRFPLVRESAQAVRGELKKHGAEFILAFFDENSADDPRWHTGHQFQRENYAFLLEKLLAEPRLGLVVKPKVPRSLRRRLGPVARLLERAEATGRCHVYEGGALHGSYPPATGALAADLAVHGHLCAATAGLEAALAGVPTLLLDREGWHVSPLYRLGVGRVVFTDWETLWKAVKEHRTTPGGIPGLGDWTPMIAEFDPFRDGRAAERMGTYLQWVIEGFKDGLDRDAVLADAAERYCARWGADKITSVDGQVDGQAPASQGPEAVPALLS